MTRRIAIIGVGLIGGSLSLAWKERRTDCTLIGWDRRPVLDEALKRQVIDEAPQALSEAVRGADLVVLAVPLGAMASVLRDMAPHLRPGTIVTDVGSVKQEVMQSAAQHLPPSVHFVGGHPMAGAEQGGLGHADAFLFENATYVLCGDDSSEAFKEVSALMESTGARVISLDAERHDRIASCVSHLPQLVACALMQMVDQHDDDPAYLRLAAGGFRDMTRIAASPFETWGPILQANKANVHWVLEQLIATLGTLDAMVQNDDAPGLGKTFDRAGMLRSQIPKDSKGFLAPLCDVYVYAEDRPGTLTHITSTLFAQEINIKDIELLKVREGTGGAFRLSFVDEVTATAAVAVLTAAGCRAHRLH